MNVTLLVSAAASLLMAVAYAAVGYVLGKRRVAPESQHAITLFSVWWYALAGLTAGGVASSILGVLGIVEVSLHHVLALVRLLAACVAVWALLYYLLYLFTGRRGLLVPLTVIYGVYYFILVWTVTAAEPEAVVVQPWSVALVYERTIAPWLADILLGFLVVPPILGAVGYFRLFFRLRDPTSRYRIALVSASVFLWFAVTLLALLLDASAHDWWQFGSRALALLATLGILIGYHPPAWVRERYGVLSVRDQHVPPERLAGGAR